MKNNRYQTLTIVLLIAPLVGCMEELEFSERGIINLEVFDEWTNQKVPYASVRVFRTLDDWAFERNEIAQHTTDKNGNLILQGLPTGEYFLDISAGNRNNWQNTYPSVYIEDRHVFYLSQSISDNLNRIISSVEGTRWAITEIRDLSDNDLSTDPSLSCYLDNVATFEKAGAYMVNEGATSCSNSSLKEGSWWAFGNDYLWFLLNEGDTVIENSISHLLTDRFDATVWIETRYVTFHYRKL